MSEAADQQHGGGPETEEEARQRRLNALRQLAGTSPQLPAVRPEQASPPARRTGRRRPWWLAAAALVLAVAIVAGLFLTGRFAPTSAKRTTTPSGPVQIVTSGAGLLCPQDIAWSPDGRRVAVLGYQQTCFNHQSLIQSQAEPAALLNVYDAQTGKQLRSIALDQPIVAAYPIAQSTLNAATQAGLSSLSLAINYEGVTWLPDGDHLAVQFQTFRPVTITPTFPGELDGTGDAINGVWLGDQQGNNVHLLAHVAANTQASSYYGQMVTSTGWDLDTKVEAPVLPASSAGTLPLALSYAWQSDGTLAPQSPFGSGSVPQSVPDGPVGRSGDASLTFWQPAVVTVHVLAPLGQPQLPDGYTFDTTMSATSPDGRYLTPPAGVRGLLEPDGQPPNPEVVGFAQLAGLPVLPIRDAALRSVLTQLTNAASDGRTHTAAVAWSPDGRYLASQFAPTTAAFSPSAYPVSIFDTRSGQLLTTLTPPATKGGTALQNQLQSISLRWSPDGTHLLMSNTLFGVSTIWGPAQLPHIG